MANPQMRFPPAKPPRNPNVLSTWIDRYAAQEGAAPERVRRALAFEFCIAAFTRGHSADDPRIIVTGGVAMELRLRDTARATKDIDAVLRDTEPDRIEAYVDSALSEPLLDGLVSFRIAGQQPIGPTSATRFDIRVLYQDRSFAKIRLEVSAAHPDDSSWDAVPPMDIAPTLGVDVGLAAVPCLSIQDQIAQKIHAVTDPHENNDRYRDLIDLILLDGLRAAEDHVVLDACKQVFVLRDRHAWPPEVVVRDGWPNGYAQLASDSSFEPADVEAAATLVQQIIDRIASAAGPSGD
ncbi:MAG: nucleotidyl transferase AbiEii/AbiGii toxin family protein [Actinobacteria bacterium]|nr:nucleotidyl transferase AbiEii/AbiGii toxin family protein [Actinomycetota bacterium]